MKNFVQNGDVVTLIAPANVSSGDPVAVGSLFGVAAFDALQGAEVEVALVGVYDLVCVGPIDAGAPVYWDGSAKKITATEAGNTLVGTALLAVGGGGTVCRVRLGGTDSAALAAQLTALADRVTALEGA